MAIRNSRYKVNNGNGYDVIHFEGNQTSIKIIDNEKEELGTLNDLMFVGKKVESGGFLNLKNTGKYQIKNVNGLPPTVNTNEWSMLIVDSIGNFNEPTITNYCLIANDGNIYNNTVVMGRESGWSIAGKKAQDTIYNMQQNIGSLALLQTSDKKSVVNAINELSTRNNSVRQKLDSHVADYNNFKNHNHDGVYLKANAETQLSSKIQVKNGGGLDIRKSNGETGKLVSVSEDSIGIGNRSTSLNLYGKDVMLYNNKIVWTEDNDGEGSGLDADKLDGRQATDFAIRREDNEFSGTQTFANVKANKINVGNTPITHSGGQLKIGSYYRLNNNGTETLNRTHLLSENGAEAQIVLRTVDGSGGIGFARPKDSGDLHLYNWDINRTVLTIKNQSDVAEFYRHIKVSGRNLYLQDNQPTDDNIPVGSIWFS